MVNYKETKSKIFWNKVKGWGSTAVCLTLGGVATVLIGLGNLSNKGAEKAQTYSESKFEEAETLKQEARAEKDKESKEWKKELEKVEKTDKDVKGGDSGWCIVM